MGQHAQKFIDDRPSNKPRVRTPPLPLQPLIARAVKLRMLVGSVHQDIGVNDENFFSSRAQYSRRSRSPSSTSYSALRSATSIKKPPLLNVGSGGSFGRLRLAWKNSRSAVSISSDMVRPCRAASRLSSAMTVS